MTDPQLITDEPKLIGTPLQEAATDYIEATKKAFKPPANSCAVRATRLDCDGTDYPSHSASPAGHGAYSPTHQPSEADIFKDGFFGSAMKHQRRLRAEKAKQKPSGVYRRVYKNGAILTEQATPTGWEQTNSKDYLNEPINSDGTYGDINDPFKVKRPEINITSNTIHDTKETKGIEMKDWRCLEWGSSDEG